MTRIRSITLTLLVIASLAGVAINQRDINQNVASLRVLTQTLDLSVLDSCGLIRSNDGHGSCVAIGPDLILTAGHCIGIEGSWIEIGGKKYDILDEWKSEQYDVGFVKIDGQVPYLELGEMPQLLDTVYLIGSPADPAFVNNVSRGVITKLDIDWWNYEDSIVSDCSGWFGNSGGALVNRQGQVIGICVAGPGSGLDSVTVCETVVHINAALGEYQDASNQ
jgi:putative serine protease PepD